MPEHGRSKLTKEKVGGFRTFGRERLGRRNAAFASDSVTQTFIILCLGNHLYFLFITAWLES
jgi:hypothetical protein